MKFDGIHKMLQILRFNFLIMNTLHINSLFYFSFRCAKDIDTLIESLPNEDSSQELQAQSLRRLEIENQEAAKRLEEVKKSTLSIQTIF